MRKHRLLYFLFRISWILFKKIPFIFFEKYSIYSFSELLFLSLQKGSKCQRMVRSDKAVHLSYKNCTSVQAYKPRYCGSCTDGRCCTPHRTKTALVEFQCASGKTTRRPVMVILTCACHNHCPRDNAVWQPSELGYSGMRL